MAKRIAETLPELPEGMKPRHIHVLDAVHEIRLRGGGCRVGDVSARLNITTPSVTKLVQELEARHLLEKYADTSDKRVALLKLTPEGEACVQRYVLDFHGRWTQELADITDSQTMDAIHILERLQDYAGHSLRVRQKGRFIWTKPISFPSRKALFLPHSSVLLCLCCDR